MFKNIIAYGFENDKLYFGRVTLHSWLYAFFKNGGLLIVKPIKGYKQYAYYKDYLCIELNNAKLVNWHYGNDPIKSIQYAEMHNGGLKTITPFTKD
jgi:hypothetical protein